MAQGDEDFWLRHAIREAHGTYASALAGRRVDVPGKGKSLLKFGRNLNMGTAGTRATVWDAGPANEVYVDDNTNPIDSISSSSGSDAIDVVVEGHTDDGTGAKTFVVQTVTLTGQTRAALTTPLNRCSRVYNNGSTALVGDVYVYQNTALTSGVPTDTTKIHASVKGTAGRQQTNKCASTISDADIYFVTSIDVGVQRNAATYVDFAFEVRQEGKIFREQALISASSNSGMIELFVQPYLIVPPNADFRVVGVAGANSTDCVANVKGLLGRLV